MAHGVRTKKRIMAKFRFQDLKICQLGIEIATDLFDVADGLEQRRLYRFADPLREGCLERLLDKRDHLCRQMTNFKAH